MDKIDAELMSAFRAGDRRAFDELVDQYADRVYSFTRRITGDDALAEDAAQEAFIKAWKSRARFDESRNFKSWIFAIAHNASIDVLRKRREWSFSSFFRSDDSNEAVDIGESLADESVSMPEAFDQKVLAGILEDTMRGLTENQRSAVVLHDIEGMTFEEVGKAMGKPMNTAKSHYRRAIASLRRKLEERGIRP